MLLYGFCSGAQKHLKKRIKEELDEMSIAGSVDTEISINLNRLRSITVYVLGEAYKPGSYTLSALSTITNTLFLSGGVNKLGSLRNIQIKREGKLVTTYDLYDLLIKGDTTTDIRLQDGASCGVQNARGRFTEISPTRLPNLVPARNSMKFSAITIS